MYFDHDVAILGAGISGLSAAHGLALRGADVIVFDRRPKAGGRIQTLRQEGFLVENGPSSMVSPAASADRLIDALGLSNERIGKTERVRHRYLVRGGRAHALPMSPAGFFSSGFFTLGGRLRLLAEPFIGSQQEDESIADFIGRRFGQEMLDYVFDPLVGGLYSADPARVSVSAIFPQLKKLESLHGSIIRGVVASRIKRRGESSFDPRRRQLSAMRCGMDTVATSIQWALGERVCSNVRVEALTPLASGGFRLGLQGSGGGGQCRVRQVIVALPAYAAARLLSPIDQEAGALLGAIEHPPLAVVGLGYRSRDIAHPLDGLGVLNPACERRNTLGLMFSSSLFAGRAPVGHELITAYVGGARQPELARLPREALVAAVRDDVRQLLGEHGAPTFCSVRYWANGLPQPTPGHVERITALRAALTSRFPGLHLTGNYVSGVSTVNCIESAVQTATRVDFDGLAVGVAGRRVG